MREERCQTGMEMIFKKRKTVAMRFLLSYEFVRFNIIIIMSL